MCTTCGCGGSSDELKIYKPGSSNNLSYPHEHPQSMHFSHGHAHDHDHNYSYLHSHTHTHEHGISHANHTHHHEHEPIDQRRIVLEQDILQANDRIAERNRGYFEAKNIYAVNLVSSPGSGKTSLLIQTIEKIGSSKKCYVIEGDQQTDNDARRIQETGVEVVQVNTGNACHLDANMVHQAIHQLNPVDNALLFIENVGNLVCPSMFDLGENNRVVIFSVTEGEDKPLKYPYIFNSSQLVIINKIDLLPYLEFNIEKAKTYIHQINPDAQIIEISVKTGLGMEKWLQWIENRGK